MSSDDVLDSCRRLFHRRDRSMQSIAALLRKARALTARSRERIDGSAGPPEKPAPRSRARGERQPR